MIDALHTPTRAEKEKVSDALYALTGFRTEVVGQGEDAAVIAVTTSELLNRQTVLELRNSRLFNIAQNFVAERPLGSGLNQRCRFYWSDTAAILRAADEKIRQTPGGVDALMAHWEQERNAGTPEDPEAMKKAQEYLGAICAEEGVVWKPGKSGQRVLAEVILHSEPVKLDAADAGHIVEIIKKQGIYACANPQADGTTVFHVGRFNPRTLEKLGKEAARFTPPAPVPMPVEEKTVQASTVHYSGVACPHIDGPSRYND